MLMPSCLSVILKYKDITKMNLSLMLFSHKINSINGLNDRTYEISLHEYEEIGRVFFVLLLMLIMMMQNCFIVLRVLKGL